MKLLTMGLAAGLLVAGLQAGAHATDGHRDPMLLPPVMRPAAVPGGAPAADTAPVVARHLMVIDGVRWVIDGGRRRGVGDLLGGARIERIEDSAIVVRNGKQLQRLPLFAGVVKRPVADAATQTARALTACPDRPSCMQRPGEPQ